jgi:predicted nucleic acid-binding protein
MLILDTNVISETMNPLPSPRVLDWWAQQNESGELYITAITVAEILYGVELLPIGKRRAALQAGAERMFGKVFAGHVLSFDEEAARAFPRIAADRRGDGRPITEFDAQIAAIARSRNAILATRNTADFQGCGVRLINPWQHNSKS